MNIKLDHINLTVANLNESIEWYKKIFSFELAESGTTPLGTKWGIVAFNDNMICMSEDPKRISADKFEDESAHQIYHFGIRISDENEWRQIVTRYSLKLYYGGINDYPSSRSWYIQDPSGHSIEVSFAGDEPLRFPKKEAL